VAGLRLCGRGGGGGRVGAGGAGGDGDGDVDAGAGEVVGPVAGDDAGGLAARAAARGSRGDERRGCREVGRQHRVRRLRRRVVVEADEVLHVAGIEGDGRRRGADGDDGEVDLAVDRDGGAAA